jgi:hypothetical protein
VPRELRREVLRFAGALHGNQLALDHHLLPLPVDQIPLRILRIGLLDVEVLRIHPEDGEAPGDSLVVADADAGQAGLGAAERVPARSDQMHGVAQRRVAPRGADRYQNRSAGDGLIAVDHPVVAPSPSSSAELLLRARLAGLQVHGGRSRLRHVDDRRRMSARSSPGGTSRVFRSVGFRS